RCTYHPGLPIALSEQKRAALCAGKQLADVLNERLDSCRKDIILNVITAVKIEHRISHIREYRCGKSARI
ncbi:hypothetical protein DL89DRAFT_266630, partial [Linderina pennispora]